jgi:hypothetical protein
MEDENGVAIQLRAMGIEKAKLSNDRERGFIEEV